MLKVIYTLKRLTARVAGVLQMTSQPVSSFVLSSPLPSARHFPEQSWTAVSFPCFTEIKSFMSWYALLLLFFLGFSSISLHCSPTQFSFAFFMHFMMLLFTSLYWKKTWGRMIVRGRSNSWKTCPLWNKEKLLQLLLSKIVHENASQKNDRYWSDGQSTALSCTITRPMEINQYWTVPKQTQRWPPHPPFLPLYAIVPKLRSSSVP